jgi:hypothetical protein
MEPAESTKARPAWQRLLVPSLSDVFFVFLILWLFVIPKLGWEVLLGDGDTGWHIRVGESILNTGTVPYTDPFSFSKPDAPWYAWEWLSEIVLAVCHDAAGLKGVVLFGGVMVAGFGLLFFRYLLWRGADTLIALAVVMLTVGAASVHFLARPHLFTFIFLTITLWMVERDRRRPSRAIWLLVPMTVLWTNLHGGFPVLFVCLGAVVAGSFLEGLWEPDNRGPKWRLSWRYSLLGVSCAAASLVNPYGWELHRHIVAYLRSDWIKKVVAEFQSPSFRAENVLQFEVLLLIGLMTAGALLLRRKVVESLWILIWAHFALSSARHIPIFAIFAAPLIAMELTRWVRKWTADAPRNSVAGILTQLSRDLAPAFRRTSLLPAAFVLLLMLSGPSLVRWPSDFPSSEFPTELIGRNADLIRSSRIFTQDEWADYLIYRYYPQQRVFMDGRTDFYGPEVGDRYVDLLWGHPEWREILDEYSFNAVLLPPDVPLASLLALSGEWDEADRDDDGVLFVPRP